MMYLFIEHVYKHTTNHNVADYSQKNIYYGSL